MHKSSLMLTKWKKGEGETWKTRWGSRLTHVPRCPQANTGLFVLPTGNHSRCRSFKGLLLFTNMLWLLSIKRGRRQWGGEANNPFGPVSIESLENTHLHCLISNLHILFDNTDEKLIFFVKHLVWNDKNNASLKQYRFHNLLLSLLPIPVPGKWYSWRRCLSLGLCYTSDHKQPLCSPAKSQQNRCFLSCLNPSGKRWEPCVPFLPTQGSSLTWPRGLDNRNECPSPGPLRSFWISL